ncbi:MAG: DNA internalization-related competence protein ComEC/Rec2 [Firmicutes bacterium]|nr:DNA internalization-related competence protein ComEC/Rec2 [Bacillota bacterium]
MLFFLFALSAGILTACYTNWPRWAVPAAVTALVAAVLYRSKKRSAARFYDRLFQLTAVLAAVFFIFGFVSTDHLQQKTSALAPYYEETVCCSGVVKSCAVKGDAMQLQVVVTRAATCDEALAAAPAVRERVLVRYDCAELAAGMDLVGRQVFFQGSCEEPAGPKSRGAFDYRRYLKSRGIRAIVSVNPYRMQAGPVKDAPLHLLAETKGRFLSFAKEYLGESSFGLFSGLLLGEKGFLQDDMKEEFETNGIAHVLAVSGLHVGLVYRALFALLGKKRSPGRCLIVLLFVYLYAAFCGFSLSVLRAAFMITLHQAAFYLRRRYDTVSAASLTALLFLCTNPFRLFDSGFQLSFAAAYAIGIALPWAENRILTVSDEKKSDLLYYLGTLCLPALLIQAAMLPLVLFHFMRWSLLSLLLNPLAILLAGLILPFGLLFFAVFLSGLQGLSVVFPLAAAGPLKAFCGALQTLSTVSYDAGTAWHLAGPVCAPPLCGLLLYYALFFWFFSETRCILRRKAKTKELCAVLLSLVVCACGVPWLLGITEDPLPYSYGRAPVTFLDVGQGDCTHLSFGSVNVLVDGGGTRSGNIAEATVAPYLLKNGVSGLELCIVTHPDLDHSKGLAQLSQQMKIRTLAFPYWCEGDPSLAEFAADEILFLKEGDLLSLGSRRHPAELRVLSPGPRDPAEGNDGSLVLRLETEAFSVLLTGDAGGLTESRLIHTYGKALQADVLKLGHHGSDSSTSAAFLYEVVPSFGVISCGRNNSYGHPSPGVIDLLQKNSIIYGRTDRSGSLSLRCKRGSLTIEDPAKETIWHIRQNSHNPSSIPSAP